MEFFLHLLDPANLLQSTFFKIFAGLFIFDLQEETATVQVTEKGGNQSQMDVFWTKDDLKEIDQVRKKIANVLTTF